MLVHFYFEIYIKSYDCQTDRSLNSLKASIHCKEIHYNQVLLYCVLYCISNTSTSFSKDIIETIITEGIQFLSV